VKYPAAQKQKHTKKGFIFDLCLRSFARRADDD
jgi:hypothetical protein